MKQYLNEFVLDNAKVQHSASSGCQLFCGGEIIQSTHFRHVSISRRIDISGAYTGLVTFGVFMLLYA